MDGWKRLALFLAPVAVLALLVSVNVSEWRTASRLRLELAESQARGLAEEINLRLGSLLRERANDLALLASILASTNESGRTDAFMSRAGGMAEREESFHLIYFVDPDSVVRLSAPKGKRPELIGPDITTMPGRSALHKRVKDSNRPLASPPVRLADGRKGMVIWHPVLPGKGFPGMVAGVVDLNALFGRAVPPLHGEFKVEIRDSGRIVYRSAAFEEKRPLLSAESVLMLLGRELAVRVNLLPGGKVAGLLDKERLHLAVGIGLSLATAVFLALALAILNRLKRSQVRLVRTQCEFKEQRDVLSGLVENIPMGVVLWDQNDGIVNANKGFTELTGYGTNDFSSMEDWFLRAYPEPDYRETVRADWNAAASEPRPIREFRVRRKDGSFVDAEFRAVFFAGGRVLITMADVSERRRAREALLEEKERAEAASKAKSEFLANMSHELRTPLNGIMTFLQILAGRGNNSPEDVRHLNLAMQSGRSLERLMADILDLSRIEAERLPLEEAPFSPAAVLGDVRRAFEARCEEKGLALTVEADGGLPGNLVGDAVRLRQVLFNLVGNAVKFTREGSVGLAARPLPVAPEGMVAVLFVIADTGPGLPEDRLEEFCEPFAQGMTGYTRRHQGAGLGLGIVKRLAGLMGGGICVENPESGGAVIYCALRFKAVSPEAFRPSGETARPKRPDEISVLLVEDEFVNALALSELLKGRGCEVRTVRNGREALEVLAAESFDCVLMDVQMPVMNGVEATERIRAGEAGEAARSVPVVALTAYAMPADRKAFADAGMDGYVAKPVDETMLFEEMARALAKRR